MKTKIEPFGGSPKFTLWGTKTPHWRTHGDGTLVLEVFKDGDGLYLDATETARAYTYSGKRDVSKRVMFHMEREQARQLRDYITTVILDDD